MTTRKTLRNFATGVLLAGTLLPPLAHASLPPALSGAWFNPAQPGHGLSFAVIDHDRVIGFWYVYDHAGNPIHLYLDGHESDAGFSATAHLSDGMRFGVFDPAEHRLRVWGEVSVDFHDCDTATLSWTTDGPAGDDYAPGSMPLARLTRVDGTECPADYVAGVVPSGSYLGSYNDSIGNPTDLVQETVHAAVDSEGRLWATDQRTPAQAVPGLVFLGAATDAPWTLQVDVLQEFALADAGGQAAAPFDQFELDFEARPDGDVVGYAEPNAAPHPVVQIHLARQGQDPIKRPFQASDLAGLRFEQFQPAGAPPSAVHAVQFDADGASVCLSTAATTCALQGSYVAEDPGMAMFAFDVSGAGMRYQGKGWVQGFAAGEPQRVVLVGASTSGAAGIGLVADRTGE